MDAPVDPSRFQPLVTQALSDETNATEMALGKVQAWTQSIPAPMLQRIQNEGVMLRVSVIFRDGTEILTVYHKFSSKLMENVAEMISLIATYLQMESGVRAAEVDLNCPPDVVKFLVSRVNIFLRAVNICERRNQKLQNEFEK